MVIQYNIVVTIVNLTDNSTSKFNKNFDTELSTTDALLYNNYHILSKGIYILDMFQSEIDSYCKALEIEQSSIEIDEFEITSLSDRVDVFFESEEDSNELSLKPTIKCYVYPKHEALEIPELTGVAYDSNTIIWSWSEDSYAHYLVTEPLDPDKSNENVIIAQLPIGVSSYTETGLTPDTAYTRRLICYTDEQTSFPSASTTVRTEMVKAIRSLEKYSVPRNYDFTADDSQREIIQENLEAFHSGVGGISMIGASMGSSDAGTNGDMMVSKQTDSDFHQNFKAYLEISGRRIEREKRYDQVGFNYKICMEAMETIEDQEGEITFDINAFPVEPLKAKQYMYATQDVPVYAKLYATAQLKKPITSDISVPVTVQKISSKEVIAGNPAYFTLSIDVSDSMELMCDGSAASDASESRYAHIKTALNKLIDTLSAQNETDGDGNLIPIYVGIITFALNFPTRNALREGSDGIGYMPYLRVNGGDTEALNNIQNIRNFINTIENQSGGYDEDCTINNSDLSPKSYTSWDAGIEAGIYLMRQHLNVESDPDIKDKNVFVFFTDGYPNSTKGNCYITIGRSFSKVKNAVINAATNLSNYVKDENRWCINMYDPSKASGGYITEKAISYPVTTIETCINNIVKNNSTRDIRLVDENPTQFKTNMENMFATVIESSKTTIPVIYNITENITSSYEIDDVKMVKVETDLIGPFYITNTLTPVVYDDKEQRAVIPKENFIAAFNQKMSETSVHDLILEAIKKTPEYKDGYTGTVGTTDGSYLINGLQIKDTYGYGDEDILTDATFDAADLEDGMVGTINVYTNMDTLSEDTYGDDCYIVRKNTYLYIDGYSDALIYDGTRFIDTELNAYNHASETILGVGQTYETYLKNRKNDNISYTGTGEGIASVLTVMERGEHVNIEGSSDLKDSGKVVIIEPITDDIRATISEQYVSPILNHRFNIEDPESKLCLYEMLPDCDVNSKYKNVVIMHIYYAKNVYVTNKSFYISSFGTDPIATITSDYYELIENKNAWTEKDLLKNIDNTKYIDEYLWIGAKPMKKTQKYYDELPGENMETMYGVVNNRYADGHSNRKDLRVDTPQFNIPTTVDKSTIKIYIVITEFHPETALVSYKWENPWNEKDSITQVNGDYVTFSSDNVTHKDVEYIDVIETINMENIEVTDNKTIEKIFELYKPKTIKEYVNYYLEVTTDNSDVLAMRYPTEITFDEEGTASIGVAFKGVVNATSKWAPRIHNGYYYINQHEYFAYSKFDVKADFETYESAEYQPINGYITFDVTLRHQGGVDEHYSITRDACSELLQDEEHFQWTDNGLTLRPLIDGQYYKEYIPYMYISPVIMFPNKLSSLDSIHIDYEFTDTSKDIGFKIRSYDIDTGAWSSWVEFENDTIPSVPLSSAYQIGCDMQASISHTHYLCEDYLCCYLDWKDDMDEDFTTNIVTITDYMTAGPDEGTGIFISNVIDFGDEETMYGLSLFESKYDKNCELYIATSNDIKSLFMEKIVWKKVSSKTSTDPTGRYMRYKIVIPYGEKVYWLHKLINTRKTKAVLPYIQSIKLTGTHSPADVVTNFINTESFEIPRNNEYHVIIDKVSDIIEADVLERGFTVNEIEHVNIQCTTKDIEIKYNKAFDNDYPASALSTSISAKSEGDFTIATKNTPYIITGKDYDDNPMIEIIGTPQQYCPITVEDPDGRSYLQLHGANSFNQEEEIIILDETKYVTLKTNRYDLKDFKVYLNDEELDTELYKIQNHLVIFNQYLYPNDVVKVQYSIVYSFLAFIDREKNTTTLYFNTEVDVPVPEKFKIFFETDLKNNKFIAEDLSMNPIYRTDYKGFIYITDEHNEPYEIKIYCNPLRLKAGGYDEVDIAIEVLDNIGNPIINKEVQIDCQSGILIYENNKTDMNGVVHLIYQSSYVKCTDTVVVRVEKDDESIIRNSISIINE